MHSGTADRLRIGNEVRELKLGRSFSSSSGSAFHSIRYDFKPASVDTSKSANVEVGEKNQITVTVPHIENSLSQNSGTAHTVFKGSQRPYNRECVLVVDNATGEVTLERLSCNIQLKKTRAEGSSKIQPRPITPIDSGSSGAGSRKHSPSQKLSPPQPQTNGKHGSSWASSSPNGPQQQQQPRTSSQQHQPRISPSQPPSQRGSPPGSQSSPSMPTLMTPREGGGGGGSSSRAPSASRDSMPLLTTETLHDCQEVPDVGVLSDSSDSSNSTSKSSASSDSSDSEHEDAPAPAHKNSSSSQPSHSSKAHHTAVNGTNGQHSSNASFSSMPRFSQLNEDLRLSESGSDSDD